MEKTDYFDPGTFQEARSIFGARFGSIVQDYFQDAENFIREIVRASETGDNAGIKSNAHPLKSSSAAFGLLLLSDLARDIEYGAGAAAQNGGAIDAETKERIDRLDDALRQARELLAPYL